MLLFQFSAAKGPDECCLAVAKALKRFLQEAIKYSLEVDILASQSGGKLDTLHSVLLSIKGEHTELLTNRWQGSIQWVCQSPYRPSHKRKNWFIGAMCLPDLQPIGESEIQFTTTKSSGAGGQHVNKTESAVRATHMATGISVKVQSQRSQHANKRLAAILLAHKLADLNDNHYQQHKAARHQFHQQIERGSAKLVFYGDQFVEK